MRSVGDGNVDSLIEIAFFPGDFLYNTITQRQSR